MPARGTPEGDAARAMLKVKFKGAVRTVALVTRQQRRLPGGRRRHSVAFGVKLETKEAHKTPAGSCNTYLSSRAQEFFEHRYTALGRWIGAKPRLSMLIGTLVLLSGVPGSFLLEGEAHVLWIAFDTRMYENFAMQTNHFYTDYEHAVHLHHGYHHPARAGLLQFTPRVPTPQGPLTQPFLGQVLDILNALYNDTHVSHGGGAPLDPSGVQGYEQVCATNELGQCRSRSTELFAAIRHDPNVLAALPPAAAAPGSSAAAANGSSFNDYWYAFEQLAGANALVYPSHVRAAPLAGGRLVADPSQAGFEPTYNLSGLLSGQVVGVSAERRPLPLSRWDGTMLAVPITTAFYAEGDGRRGAVVAWEKAAIARLEAGRYPHAEDVRVTFVFEASVQTEIAASVESAVPMVFVTVGVMIAYSITFLFTQVRCREGEMTCAYVVMQGALIPALSGISALGWMCYLGFRVNLLCAFVLFLVLCVGVDCTFIFISAMKAVDPNVGDLAEATSMSLAEAGPAVTLTSLTSLCAFFLSAGFAGAMPGMMVFNLCMAVALLLNVIGFVFFFTAWQVINETRISEDLSDFNLFNYKIGPHDPPRCLQTRAGEGKLPSWVDLGNKLRAVVVTRYAPLLERSLPFQLLGAAVMAGSLAVSLYFIPSIGLGTPSTTYVADTSYLQPLFADFDSHGGGFRPLSLLLLVEHLDLASAASRAAFVTEIIAPILRRDDVLGTSCFAEQYAYYADAGAAAGVPGAALPWQAWLNESLADPASGASLGPARLATFGHTLNPHTEAGTRSGEPVPQSFECAIAIRQAADDAVARLEQARFFSGLQSAGPRLGDGVHVYVVSHNYAEVVSQDEELVLQILMTIVIALCAVASVLVLAIPVHRAFITAVNILLVVINILGFMGYAGISYNPVSFCTLTMAIGFCVDYTVELMHFSSTAGAGADMAEKMGSALAACGYDVMHGCATAIVGCLVISFVPGEAFRMFGHLSMVMCAYGGMYALWCLPATMILCERAMRACCCPRGEAGGAADAGTRTAWGAADSHVPASPAVLASKAAMAKLRPKAPLPAADYTAAIAAPSASSRGGPPCAIEGMRIEEPMRASVLSLGAVGAALSVRAAAGQDAADEALGSSSEIVKVDARTAGSAKVDARISQYRWLQQQVGSTGSDLDHAAPVTLDRVRKALVEASSKPEASAEAAASSKPKTRAVAEVGSEVSVKSFLDV